MYSSVGRGIRRQWVGVLALLAVICGVANAATGAPFVLGGINAANRSSTLRNDGTGPALTLRVARDQPPLRVNSAALVRRLNAGLLQGHDAADFALATNVYTKPESDSRYAPAAGYTAEGTLQLLAKSGEPPQISDDPFMVAAPIVDVRVRAPADGVMTIRVWGLCVGSDAAGSLEIATNGIVHSFPVTEDAVSFCEASWSQTVVFADVLEVQARVHSTLGPLILGDWTATIVFVPAP